MKTYFESYSGDLTIHTIEDISKEQIKFADFVGTEIEQYIKEGSLKSIDKAEEIYIKLPNWGDVKLSWYKHTNTFTNTEKKYNDDGKEIESEKIRIDYNFLTTKLKIKVMEGDNSGYTKYYFTNLCWQPKEGERHTTVQHCIDTVNVLIKNNPPKEYIFLKNDLINDKSAFYFDIGGEGI